MRVETVEPDESKSVFHVLLLTALLVLPGVIWSLLGWISAILPLIAFSFINKFGWGYTNRKLGVAVFAASILSVFLQSLELTLFSVMLIPAGYVIALSAQRYESPWLSVFKGTITLTVSLIVFFGILLASSEISFFTALTESLNRAIEETLKHYQQGGSLSVENYAILERTLYQMKHIAPIIIPAILMSLITLVSWSTVTFGNILLPKLNCGQPWAKYRYWNLPEKLIWGLIISAILALVPGETTQIAGINGLIIFALLYCFQGLAVLIYQMHRWRVPRMVRSIVYIIMILQSFGTIVLVGLGIADVWLETRRPPSEQINDKKETE